MTLEQWADRISTTVEKHRSGIVNLLRELIAIPSVSGSEQSAVRRFSREMKTLRYDDVAVDGFGNVLGVLGHGPFRIFYDSHLDTVDVGNPSEWTFDPFGGKIEDGCVWGRGASDNKGAAASMVVAGAIARDLGLLEGKTLIVLGSVLEEPCEGLAYRYILSKSGFRPDLVVLGECTGGRLCHGHRGRIEIEIKARGLSSHASTPELGRNAVVLAAETVCRLENLSAGLPSDPNLGNATMAVTRIQSQSASNNAIPSFCLIHVDRRTVTGETRESVLRGVIQCLPSQVSAEVVSRSGRTHTGEPYEMDQVFPAWVLDPNHPFLKKASEAFRILFRKPPELGFWNFSTHGAYTMGVEGIPTIGFGPGDESFSHSPMDHVPIESLLQAARFYSFLPLFLP